MVQTIAGPIRRAAAVSWGAEWRITLAMTNPARVATTHAMPRMTRTPR